MPRLIVLAGLPGTGKSAIARAVAQATGAMWLRIDTIEQAILASEGQGLAEDAGYRAAQAVATDNLRLGRDVIGDSVNPWMETRDAWRDAGLAGGAEVIEVEIICSDAAEHRRRVEARESEVPGLVPPTWQEVVDRDYRPWTRERLVIDTAGRALAPCVAEVLARLQG